MFCWCFSNCFDCFSRCFSLWNISQLRLPEASNSFSPREFRREVKRETRGLSSSRWGLDTKRKKKRSLFWAFLDAWTHSSVLKESLRKFQKALKNLKSFKSLDFLNKPCLFLIKRHEKHDKNWWNSGQCLPQLVLLLRAEVPQLQAQASSGLRLFLSQRLSLFSVYNFK